MMNVTVLLMKNTGLELEVERGAVGCARVALRGELDRFSGPSVTQTLEELIASGRTTITLDLSKLSFMDSAGHRSIAGVADFAESRGGEILLGDCSRQVRRFLFLTTGILASARRDTHAVGAVTDRLPRAVGF